MNKLHVCIAIAYLINNTFKKILIEKAKHFISFRFTMSNVAYLQLQSAQPHHRDAQTPLMLSNDLQFVKDDNNFLLVRVAAICKWIEQCVDFSI